MGGRRGRRDNGLEAAEYAVAGDVDPRVGEHLLDVLAAAGIAAYLQPTADLHPITRTTIVPARPTDRLYVDRQHLATARDYLTQLSGGGTEPRADAATASRADIDEAWARIVADLRADLDPKTSTWPDSGRPGSWPDAGETGRDGDTSGNGDNTSGNGDTSGSARGATTGEAGPETANPDQGGHFSRPLRRLGDDDQISLLDGLDTFGANLPDEDEGSYTPPPPPPLPRLSKAAVVAVLAIMAGFILFLWPSLVPVGEDLARLIGFVACFAGVAALIWRLRSGDDEDDYYDPDHGAVV